MGKVYSDDVKAICIEMLAKGHRPIEVSNETGISIASLYHWFPAQCREAKEKRYSPKKERNEKIIALRKQGIGQTEISEKLGMSVNTVKNVLKTYNRLNDEKLEPVAIRCKWQKKECDIERMLQEIDASFHYVSGYENNASRVIVHCEKCCNDFETSYWMIREKKLHCQSCKSIQAEQKAFAKLEEIEHKRILAEEARKQREIAKELERAARIKVIECSVCGNEFQGNARMRYCSDECRRKASNAFHHRRRDHRFDGQERDKGISARALYKKDNGICHICGGLCDLNDYMIIDGAFIAGNSYPSVDHVIACANGGSDTWANVKLAHRFCNSIKGAR